MRIRGRIAALAALLALTLLVPPPEVGAQANPRYWLQVVGDDGTTVTTGYCRVLNAGLNTEPTIYSESTLTTTRAIPISIGATGECDWYQTRGLTYDVIVYVTGGNYKGSVARVDAFTGVARVVVGRSHGTKVLVTPFSGAASVATQTASETFPRGALIREVIVETKTAVAGSTMVVGVATHAIDRLCLTSVGATQTVGFTDCAPTQLMLHASAGLALIYSKQGHATAGYIHTYYRSSGNEP